MQYCEKEAGITIHRSSFLSMFNDWNRCSLFIHVFVFVFVLGDCLTFSQTNLTGLPPLHVPLRMRNSCQCVLVVYFSLLTGNIVMYQIAKLQNCKLLLLLLCRCHNISEVLCMYTMMTSKEDTERDSATYQSNSKKRQVRVLSEMNAVLHTLNSIDMVLSEIEDMTRSNGESSCDKAVEELREWTNMVGFPEVNDR